MSFLLSRRSLTSVIQMKIQLLTNKTAAINPSNTPTPEPEISPTLQELQGKKHRVKRFSDLFERQPWLSKFGAANWWLDEMISPNDANTTIEFEQKIKKSSTPKVRKIERKVGVEDFIKIEQNYIKELGKFISELRKKLKNGVGFEPMRIRDHESCVYGNIMELLNLHATVIMPGIMNIERNKGKCADIVDLLHKLFNENKFYCYVNYKLLETIVKKCKSQLFRSSDYLVFNVYDIFDEYIDFLSCKFNDDCDGGVKDLVRREKLEKTIGNFMGFVYDAKQVTMIQQIDRVSLDVLYKLYNMKNKNDSTKNCPILPLVPSKHVKFGYRQPVRILII